MRSIKQQDGFSLLEVLITMVIVAVGVLGVAGLQMYGIKNTHSAHERVQAAVQAYSIIDNMRANQIATRGGKYNVTASQNFQQTLVDCVGESKNCSTTQLATYDIYKWKQNLSYLGSSGNGSVVSQLNSDGFAVVTVTVTWSDPLSQDDTPSEFTLVVEI